MRWPRARRDGAGRERDRQPHVEFLCRAEDFGVVAEPVPARACLPGWFGRLPGVARSELAATNNGLTVKRCMPFLDALTAGWVIPLSATVRLEISDGGRVVTAGWEFDRDMVSNHGMFQVAGNPFEPHPPMKFHNYWTVRTPPGWSCLFVPALNRWDGVVHVLSGVVDTDAYQSPVNFPFFATAADGVHVLEKGTPLVQVLPFRRDDLLTDGTVRAETAQEAGTRERIHRSTTTVAGWYRRNARATRAASASR